MGRKRQTGLTIFRDVWDKYDKNKQGTLDLKSASKMIYDSSKLFKLNAINNEEFEQPDKAKLEEII